MHSYNISILFRLIANILFMCSHALVNLTTKAIAENTLILLAVPSTQQTALSQQHRLSIKENRPR